MRAWLDLGMRRIVFPFLVLFILMNSCTTYVYVQVLKPAAVTIGDVKNLAVLDFDFVGSWNFEERKPPEKMVKSFSDLLKLSVDLPAFLTSKGNYPRDPRTAFPGSDVSIKFITKLVENGHYSVVERDKISNLIDEQKMHLSGFVKEKKSIEIGEMLGVDAIIIGSGSYSVEDRGFWKELKNKDLDGMRLKVDGSKDTLIYVYRIKRMIHAQLAYRIVSVETGEIIAAKENNAKKIVHHQDRNPNLASAKIPSWKPIVNRLTDQLVQKSIKQIAPHHTISKKKIKKGRTPAMKAGLQYAKRTLWDDAKKSWETVLTDNSPKSRKDRLHAMYNIGLYHEIHNDLDKAEEIFDQCYKISGKNEYLDARVRIQRRKKELEDLEKQINTDN